MELKDKTVLFLGSSVTYGSAAGGVSFADLMGETCRLRCVKQAVSGTTLADINERSYVARLKAIGASVRPDLMICQLSTNDAAPSKGVDLRDTEAAIRFILEYAETVFRCPVVFFTGTFYENKKYETMIDLLYSLQAEYRFSILDLFHDAEMRAVAAEDYARYMKDPIHPTLDGYREWWTPRFISFCEALAEP